MHHQHEQALSAMEKFLEDRNGLGHLHEAAQRNAAIEHIRRLQADFIGDKSPRAKHIVVESGNLLGVLGEFGMNDPNVNWPVHCMSQLRFLRKLLTEVDASE